MIKDITRYVQKCLSCQKERLNKKLNIKQEINRLIEI